MAIFLFETKSLRQRFEPLTANRPLITLLSGGMTLLEKWSSINAGTGQVFTVSEAFLRGAGLPDYMEPGDYLINGARAPVKATLLFDGYSTKSTENAVGLVSNGNPNWDEKEIEAVKLKERVSLDALFGALFNSTQPHQALDALLAPQQIRWTEVDISSDYHYPEAFLNKLQSDINVSIELTRLALSRMDLELVPLPASNQLYGKHPVLIEQGASIRMSMLNTENGPIYLGRNVKVMEGCMLRGPLYLGEGTVLKMGTRLYGPVATGENCVLGGEIKNSIFHKGTNKGHEGYIGDSIIGAYCNFGAGSGGSNVKNTGGPVRLYDYQAKAFRAVGQKFGALVGDYTRVGVGTQLTTGSSIGTCCNLFGLEIQPKVVAAFSWGSGSDLVDYHFDRAISHLGRWLDFKEAELPDGEFQILNHIFEQTRGLR